MRKIFPIIVPILFLLPTTASATAYYVDFTCATDGIGCSAVGTATSTPFTSLNQFANVARSAGDIAFVRRGVASTTSVTAVTFTTSATINNPITISADYDNLWGDFATSSQTFTPVFGSKFMASSASTTDAFPHKWIYIQGDCSESYNSKVLNPCSYAYEVQAASSTGIQLYLPYKGLQSGAGSALRVMPSNPQVGTITEANTIFTLGGKTGWYFKGLDLRSTNSGCIVTQSISSGILTWIDMIFQTDGVNACLFSFVTNGNYFFHIRSFDVANSTTAFQTADGSFKDSLIDCNGDSSSVAIAPIGGTPINLDSVEVKNCTTIFSAFGGNSNLAQISSRNLTGQSAITLFSGANNVRMYFEDIYSTVGLNRTTTQLIFSDALATTTTSDSLNIRSGGGPTALAIFPPAGTGATGISTVNFPLSFMKFFEYPIYANTASKTYTVYFRSASSSAFTVNPLTATAAGSSTPELFIECEYYGDTTDANRKLTRSSTANAVNFNTDTNWYGISVTCQPSQSGVLYLRGWYAKPRENPTNQFYMDTTPVVS